MKEKIKIINNTEKHSVLIDILSIILLVFMVILGVRD